MLFDDNDDSFVTHTKITIVKENVLKNLRPHEWKYFYGQNWKYYLKNNMIYNSYKWNKKKISEWQLWQKWQDEVLAYSEKSFWFAFCSGERFSCSLECHNHTVHCCTQCSILSILSSAQLPQDILPFVLI